MNASIYRGAKGLAKAGIRNTFNNTSISPHKSPSQRTFHRAQPQGLIAE